MNVNRFERVDGLYVETIIGSSYGYSISDFEDFYDIPQYQETGGYQGAYLLIYDFRTKKVYQPFEKQRNVTYLKPLSYDGFLYFMQGDFNRQIVTLYRYLPDVCLEKVWETASDAVDLYNLQLMGEGVHVISQHDEIRSYYPEVFTCPVHPHESLMWMEDNKLYFSMWVEEGVEDGVITDRYRYYEKVVVKDRDGHILSEELGNLRQKDDGTWWLG